MRTCMLDECNNLTDNPKFCSLSCGAKHQQRNTVRTVKTRVCVRADCGAEFIVEKGKYENKYCSRSCAAKVNNASRWHAKKEKISAKSCLHCGNPAVESYCSNQCQQSYRSKKQLEAWLAGEWDATTTSGVSKTVRDFLIKEAGNRCTAPTCAVPGGFAEINPVTGRCPLEVDHLDGNCYNNTRENLMVVCPNCHALTPTYRALNTGSGRAYRRTT